MKIEKKNQRRFILLKIEPAVYAFIKCIYSQAENGRKV